MTALTKIFSKSTTNKSISVNLLPQDAFSRSTVGKVLTWSLTTGRYLVIFTEMIVILTFLSRFTLDRQLTDLNESIVNKQAIVESYGNLETQVREIQYKTDFIAQLQSRVDLLEILYFLEAHTPPNISLDELSVSTSGFNLESTTPSPLTLSEFVNTLRSDSRFSDVSISKMNTDDKESLINFSLSAKFSN